MRDCAMKMMAVILMMVAYAASAQVKVNEIKMKFGSEYHKAKEPDVVFPVMSTGNKIVDDKINLFAIKELTGVDSVSNFSTVLFQSMNEGLSELDYAITLNTDDILSYRFDVLGCGAYCEPYSLYFNFDLHTGEPLRIQNVVSSDKLDSFRAVVFSDKMKALKQDLMGKGNLLKAGKMDSAEYNFISEKIKECMWTVSVDKFLFFKNELRIFDDCLFPHAVKGLQPLYQLNYSYITYKRFFNPELIEKIN